MKYVSEFVYGGIDGTITTMAIVAASAGAGLPSNVIIILGLANVLADGFSMGISRYLSAKAEHEMNNPGAPLSPIKSGLATLAAFVIIGLIPLAAFIWAYVNQKSGEDMYPYAYALTALAFFLVGSIKSKFTGKSAMEGGLETLAIGGTGAIIAWGIGNSLKNLAPQEYVDKL